jgi:hypothetical protein
MIVSKATLLIIGCGTTQAGLSVLEASSALPSCVSAATVAAANRAVELSRILANEADQSVTEAGF